MLFKGEALPGEQPAIIDRDLFNAVQKKLNEQANNRKTTRTRTKFEALLTGRIFDDRGNRMSPGIGVTRLSGMPVEWHRQHEMLGLPTQ